MNKPNVAFVCVHNSCRSQMAEALARLFASEVYNAYSAGTEVAPKINQDAVSIIKELYGVDMSEHQHSKSLEELPEIDILITMGCNVSCPVLDYDYISEDWGLDDPSGKSDDEFKKVIDEIDFKVKDLINRLKN